MVAEVKKWIVRLDGKEEENDREDDDPTEPTKPDTEDETKDKSGPGGEDRGGGKSGSADSEPIHVIEVLPSNTANVGDQVTIKVYAKGIGISVRDTKSGELLYGTPSTESVSETVIFNGIDAPKVKYPIEVMPPKTVYLHTEFGGQTVSTLYADSYGGLQASTYTGVYGSAFITYTTKSFSFKTTKASPGIYFYLVNCSSDGFAQSVQIEFVKDETTDGSTGTSASVTIQLIDRDTAIPVVDAAVTIDGIYKGQTDSAGKLFVGLLDPGTHNISATASGYIPTADDSINNDSFSV